MRTGRRAGAAVAGDCGRRRGAGPGRAAGVRGERFAGGGGAGALGWRAPAPPAAPLVWLARRAPPAECALDAFVVGGGVAAAAGLADARPAPRGAGAKPAK